MTTSVVLFTGILICEKGYDVGRSGIRYNGFGGLEG